MCQRGAAETRQHEQHIEERDARVKMEDAAKHAPQPPEYITHEAAFDGLSLYVDERVLIPRKETELLVATAIGLPPNSCVLDIGTGCGAVAIAIARRRPDIKVYASDVSVEALAVATKNAWECNFDSATSITWIHEAGYPAGFKSGKYTQPDMIVANLPYLTGKSVATRDPSVLHEPSVAVFDYFDQRGLGLIREVAQDIPPGMRVAFEHDTHHGPDVRAMLTHAATLIDDNNEERTTVGWSRL